MMYDELVKSIRQNTCHFDACGMRPRGKIPCPDRLALQAADAIEKLLPFKKQVEKGMGLLDKADELLKAVKPRWITVEERLLEEGVSVQVCFRSQGGVAQAVSERINDNNKSYWSGLCGMKPTHWMPLPEPPKEET